MLSLSSTLARHALRQCTLTSSCLMSRAQMSSVLTPSFDKRVQRSTTTTLMTPVRGMSSDHVRMWSAERLVSLAAIPVFILPFAITNPLTDALFSTLFVLHSHWGVEAIVVDYIRPSLFGGSTVIPGIAQALVWVLSAFTLGGLYYFNYADVGIVKAVKMLWKL